MNSALFPVYGFFKLDSLAPKTYRNEICVDVIVAFLLLVHQVFGNKLHSGMLNLEG